ncbi:heparinase II/III domain-containing protein [Brachybacterium paraconglomeratum]|uniref:heparinase II/III domain-containing protein n=1 Tax=Brachybacterium paraconglomeratum TaxID=173362 RepID=UPI003F7B395A
MTGASPLREAWGLAIDLEDEYGTGPRAARRAGLPVALSQAFDRAGQVLPVPRLEPGGGPTALPEELREALAGPARASVAAPLPFPLLRQYARYWRDGVRTDYEDDVRRLGIMTGEAVLAAVGTGETHWIDRAADGLMLLCELSTWCWVAHEEAHDRRGWVVPDPDSPVVDLGAAQTLQVLAWADLALDGALEERMPGVRARIRREARIRVFEPYLARRDWHWLHGAAHNWTGWIHQHLSAAALLLLDGEDDRADRDAILALSIAQLDRYLASFPADGGTDEGFSYYWNGACRLLEAIDLLITASGGLLPREAVARIEVIGALLRFPQRMELGDGWFVNVADGPARPPSEQPWDVLHRWAHALGAGDVAAQALAHRGSGARALVRPQTGLGRVLVACGDATWRAADGHGAQPVLPAETWLQDVQLLVARERGGDPGGPALAVKGGHNDEAHNHLDVGSYLVALDGAPVLIDLGQPTYTARTFTERRYEIWTMTSSWHNLPEIRGHQQGVGERFRAVELQPELQEAGTAEALCPGSGSALHLELREAYPAAAGLRSWRRTAALDRDARTVRVSDTWELEARSGHESVPPVVLHHVIAGDPLEHAPGLLRVRTLSGSVAELRWEAELGAGALERREIDDPLLTASWGGAVHRLSLPGAERGSAALTVTAADTDQGEQRP